MVPTVGAAAAAAQQPRAEQMPIGPRSDVVQQNVFHNDERVVRGVVLSYQPVPTLRLKRPQHQPQFAPEPTVPSSGLER